MKEKENIDKILEDILLLEPKLKSDKKNLKKVIKTISELNPNFKTSKDFKKKLKNRINSMIELKTKVKPRTNYMHLFAYTFSGLFAAFWFFYMFSDSLFIWKSNPIEFQKAKMTEDTFTEGNNQNSIMSNEIENIVNQSIIEDNDTVEDQEEVKITDTNDNPSILNESEPLNIEIKEESDKLENVVDDTNPKVKISRASIEEIETKEEGEWDTSTETNEDTFNQDIESMDFMADDQADSEIWGLWINSMSKSMYSDPVENDFWTYCSNIWWEFNNNNWVSYCVLAEDKCSEEEYNLWSCDEIYGIEDIDLNIEELFDEFTEKELFE